MAAISNLGYAIYESGTGAYRSAVDAFADALRSRLHHERAIELYVDSVRTCGYAEDPYVSAVLWRLQCAHVDFGVPNTKNRS